MLRMLTRLARALLPTLALLAGILPAGALAWEQVGPAGEPATAVTTLAVAAGNSDVVYSASATALYRSADAGATWVVSIRQANIVALAAGGPTGPDSVFAYFWPAGPTGRQGLMRSLDGGRTWADPALDPASAPSGQATALALDPSDGRSLLLAVTSPTGSGSIVRSGDGGRTWQPLPMSPAPLTFPSSLAVSAAEPDALYATFRGPTGSGVRVFRTTDDGATWAERGSGLPEGVGSFASLAAHPTAPGSLALSLVADGQSGIYRTDDGGQTWTEDVQARAASLGQVTALAFSANGRWLLAATTEGMWREAWQPAIAPVFAEYYRARDGLRLLGLPLAPAAAVDGRLVQYFEKGRLENHRGETSDPNWDLMYGLLVDELHEARANAPVGGDRSTASYGDLHMLAGFDHRLPPPPPFVGGVWELDDGGAFIPFDAQLAVEPGHTVPRVFWEYINHTDLFPGGWLHDVGLPVTEPFEATVYKGIVQANRVILVQAFQRTVLTFDPANPPEWQVERANVGSDYARAFPNRVK